MQEFWHTVTYNLEDQTYFFTLDDKVFEVNADLLHNALQITPKDPDHPFVIPPPHDDIVSFIKKLRYPEDLEQVSKMEHFKFQTDSREISKKKKELFPFTRFMKLIIKYILSHHNNVSNRIQSYNHVIKINAVLRNLKFTNKGEKDPIYGMAIPMKMMSDEIKASTYYSNYLAKSKGDNVNSPDSVELIWSTCLTLSSAEYGNPFINENHDVSLTDVLKDPAKIEIQSMVEVAIGQEDPSYNTYPAHKALYDALLASLLVDEDDMDNQFVD
ncbi:hypothetical protein Tco_0584984 [Tanacetum coccineum]